ncbi:MAG TPA: hypothetical protein VMB72_01920, partial [Acidimicrobiales bacterium]|nr:hypothetical protein [Acidimicrobiales bacterium]
GRHRVEGQVHTARLVGQFAVQLGRRRVVETLDHFVAPAPAPAPPPVPDPAREVRSDQHPSAVWARPVEAVAPPAPSARPGTNGVVGEAATALAIPGYDALSASQVVQRLEGLSAEELEEVRAHEHAHRQRRTILHRVDQLLAAPGDAPA